jgi:hypothetical protein
MQQEHGQGFCFAECPWKETQKHEPLKIAHLDLIKSSRRIFVTACQGSICQ